MLTSLYGERLARLSVERLVIGVFFTGLHLSNGLTGVAYTPPELIQRASTRILKGQMPRYRGMRVAQLLSSREQPGTFSSVIRLATLNALSVPYFTGDRYQIKEDGDLSAFGPLFTGRRVAMVGAIVPLLRRIAPLAPAHVSIIDKKKETQAAFSSGDYVPIEETQSTLAQCETAVLTGASIANGSIETLLTYLPKDAAVAVVGPTAAFVPEPLFARGVAMVGTSVVTDGDQAMEIISEGGGAYQLFGTCVRKINMVSQAWANKLRPHSSNF